jgi:hypothetical protein
MPTSAPTARNPDRKTVRRLCRPPGRWAGPGRWCRQLTDSCWEWRVRRGRRAPGRPGSCRWTARADFAVAERGMSLAKVRLLLGRRGVVVPYRTVHRFASTEPGYGRRRRATVRVVDGKPGGIRPTLPEETWTRRSQKVRVDQCFIQLSIDSDQSIGESVRIMGAGSRSGTTPALPARLSFRRAGATRGQDAARGRAK